VNALDQRRSEKARSDLPSVGPLSELVAGLPAGTPLEVAPADVLGEGVEAMCLEIADPLADDILFGPQALLRTEDRFAGRLLDAWEDGGTSLPRLRSRRRCSTGPTVRSATISAFSC
jgi:hypothetical protein